jgi:hypothetical protein
MGRLSDHERANILGLNAARFFGFDADWLMANRIDEVLTSH